MQTFKQFLDTATGNTDSKKQKDPVPFDDPQSTRKYAFVQGWAFSHLSNGDSLSDAVEQIKNDSSHHESVSRVFGALDMPDKELTALLKSAADKLGIALRK